MQRSMVCRPKLDRAVSPRYLCNMQIDLTSEQQDFVRELSPTSS
jgi:hypothetical protein